MKYICFPCATFIRNIEMSINVGYFYEKVDSYYFYFFFNNVYFYIV